LTGGRKSEESHSHLRDRSTRRESARLGCGAGPYNEPVVLEDRNRGSHREQARAQ
jgi:hypothetical protein